MAAERAGYDGGMACLGGAVPRGSVRGIVWAGDADAVMEETPPESLLDELGVRSTDYFLRVRGFSMKEAGIEEGDLVQIRPLRPGTTPPDGAIVLAEVDLRQAVGESSGVRTMKRFFRERGMVRLEPANPSLESQHYKLDDIMILGVIIKIIRQLPPS